MGRKKKEKKSNPYYKNKETLTVYLVLRGLIIFILVRAVLRRVQDAPAETEYRVGELYVCPQRHSVRAAGREVALTCKEFELLCLLLENSGRVLTREIIMDRVWGSSFDGESRTVDVHVRSLRSKLGPAGSCIETVRGFGYKIAGGQRA